ncbi:MAG: UDP-N-acetylmuramate--L-alanine ligase [Anaerolineae bacterium]
MSEAAIDFSRLRPGGSVHIVGIGGAGMSAIATVLLERGYRVSGSDQNESPLIRTLLGRGAQVFVGHRAENVGEVDMLIMSSAIKSDNAELSAGRRRGIPISKRAQLLGWLMQGAVGVAVAGAHGKTTTTAMIASILMDAGRDPSFIVGGTIARLNTPAHAGRGREFVIEADEYDHTFLGLTPSVAVVTNVEHDHPDCFPTFESMLEAFRAFVGLLPEGGLLVACGDDAAARGLMEFRGSRDVMTYGFGRDVTWQATDLRVNNAGGSDFLVARDGVTAGLLRLRVPGRHNVLNALASVAATDFLGVTFEEARAALLEFRGVGRRFELRGEACGVMVIDDYGHHPTEIRATLAAARTSYPGRSIWAVWQPHTFSRTKLLLDEFAASFEDADHVIVTEVYASREKDSLGVSVADVVKRMRHRDARQAASLNKATTMLAEHVKPGDVVITLSAGDGNQVGESLLRRLQEGC